MGNDQGCIYQDYHYGGPHDKDQCGTFEYVKYPYINGDRCKGMDYNEPASCTFAWPLFCASIICPIIALNIMALLAYYMFIRGRPSAEEKCRALPLWIMFSVWSCCPIWLCVAKFQLDTMQRNSLEIVNHFGNALIFTAILMNLLVSLSVCSFVTWSSVMHISTSYSKAYAKLFINQ